MGKGQTGRIGAGVNRRIEDGVQWGNGEGSEANGKA